MDGVVDYPLPASPPASVAGASLNPLDGGLREFIAGPENRLAGSLVKAVLDQVDLPYQQRYIDEAGCGLVVPIGDVTAMADAIEWVHGHRDEAAEMGSLGRRMVLDRYTWGTEKHRLLDLYDEVLSAR